MEATTTTLGAITPGEIFSQPSDNFQDIYVLTTFDDRVLAEVLPYDVLMGEAEANAALYCDAHNTAQKTGKLPSQLLQERDELVGALREAEERAQELSDLLSKGTYTEGSITDQYMKRLLSTLKYPKP